MSKLIKIIVVLVILMPGFVHAQTVTWQKWYDYENRDNNAQDVVEANYGGYVVLMNNYSGTYATTLLIKTNVFGKTVWESLISYPLTNNDPITCYSIQTAHNGYTISGFGRDSAVLLKTDEAGKLMWLKKYSKDGLTTTFTDHSNTFDGGIIAGGNFYSLTIRKIFIVKTDSTGNIEWELTLDPIGNEVVNKIIQTQDSNYYFTGKDIVTKITIDGVSIWSKQIPKIGSDMLQYSANEIFLAGSNPNMYLVKIDSTGEVAWHKSYFPGAGCLSMCLSRKGNFLLTGLKDTLGTLYTAVTNVDIRGNEIYRKIIVSAPASYFFYAWSVKSTRDSGFIFAGKTDYPSSVFNENALVIKSDSLCNTSEFVGINNSTTKPDDFILFQNYPNPFNPETNIEFSIPRSSSVSLDIFDVTGKLIKTLLDNEFLSGGSHSVKFFADGLPSGIYYYRLGSEGISITKKMMLVK